MEAQEIISCDRINSPFVSGGVAEDVIREVTGDINTGERHPLSWSATGALSVESGGIGYPILIYDPITTAAGFIRMKLSRVVPTGPENSPRTLSVLYWRRVA